MTSTSVFCNESLFASQILNTMLTKTELNFWEESQSSEQRIKLSNEEISKKYEQGSQRILTEINREKLPSFIKSLKQPGYMNTRPFYQRRDRWSQEKQSLLIESFLINVPVPPIVLYENEFNTYEVMDGQQRITALRDFYDNKLTLKGLKLWPELNDKRYLDLPNTIRAGIDRRSISSIVLITESAPTEEDALELKQLAFERLNTGGVDLSPQEVRNCLYHGRFNSLLLELSENVIFKKAWGIPIIDGPDKNGDKDDLKNNNFYRNMGDAELVLRFFALRNVHFFRKGMKGFLDLYMMKSLGFDESDVVLMRNLFIETIQLIHDVYGDLIFKPYNINNEDWEKKPKKAYYDSKMIGFSRHLNQKQTILEKREDVIAATREMFKNDTDRLLYGKAKSKPAIQKVVDMTDLMLQEIL